MGNTIQVLSKKFAQFMQEAELERNTDEPQILNKKATDLLFIFSEELQKSVIDECARMPEVIVTFPKKRDRDQAYEFLLKNKNNNFFAREVPKGIALRSDPKSKIVSTLCDVYNGKKELHRGVLPNEDAPSAGFEKKNELFLMLLDSRPKEGQEKKYLKYKEGLSALQNWIESAEADILPANIKRTVDSFMSYATFKKGKREVITALIGEIS